MPKPPYGLIDPRYLPLPLSLLPPAEAPMSEQDVITVLGPLLRQLMALTDSLHSSAKAYAMSEDDLVTAWHWVCTQAESMHMIFWRWQTDWQTRQAEQPTVEPPPALEGHANV